MEVCIKQDSPVILNSAAKAGVKSMIPDFAKVAERYQRRIEEFLMGNSADASFVFADSNFAFRYASGGVLPILEIDGQSFYCLLYRDIDPVGWNIANGGTDTREELLNPLMTIEREFCEELLIIDDLNSLLLRFDFDRVGSVSKSKAREYWKLTYERWCKSKLNIRKIPVQWINGPDSLSVTVVDDHNEVSGCFLNINALDFGVEVDRVAKISLHKEIIACDGELFGKGQINRPIGLFSVEKVNERIVEGVRHFEPDIIFHDGLRMPGTQLDDIVYDRFLPALSKMRTPRDRKSYRIAKKQRVQYDLCPVTSSIIRRYIALDDSMDFRK